MSDVISVNEAFNIIDKTVKINPVVSIALKDCLGYCLAEDIYSRDNIPCYDNSAMDGFALRAEDTNGAGNARPVVLNVIGEIPAGRPSGLKLKQGQALSIMTGGMVPEGADAVIRKEDTETDGKKVKILADVDRGANIRLAGEDIKKGDKLFESGHRIKAADMGVLASIGEAYVSVHKKPTVAILVTGDEIIDPGEVLKPGKVRNSNLYGLCGMLEEIGIDFKYLGHGKDSIDDIKEKLNAGRDADIIITTGAVSVGKYDFVRDAFEQLGMKKLFWKVAQRPGKPLLFGKLDKSYVFGLPGNPVSATVCFSMYVQRALLKLMGAKNYAPEMVSAEMETGFKKPARLTHFLRGVYRFEGTKLLVKPLVKQGSGILRSMSLANCLLVISEEIEEVQEGDRVNIIMFG